jgi:group I intron endonuclease
MDKSIKWRAARSESHPIRHSSINLSKRLSYYFMPSYLKSQADRPGAIFTAILKHGLVNFSIQVIELGSSPDRSSVKITDDFILLEQFFLNTYVLAYNIRRIALGPASTYSNENIKFGELNPQL